MSADALLRPPKPEVSQTAEVEAPSTRRHSLPNSGPTLPSGSAPHTSAWYPLVPRGWRVALIHPAVWVDEDEHQCFIHGGRVDGRLQLVSSSLLRVDLQAFAAAPPSLSDMTGKGGDGVSPAVARPQVQILYTDTTSTGHSALSSSKGPSLWGHALLRHGSLLVIHGGLLRPSQASEGVYAYHMRTSQWEDIRADLGGCTPPRMHGHAVVRISENKGLYLVLGVVCKANGLAVDEAAPGHRGGPPGLRAFILHLQDRTRGWEEMRLAEGMRDARGQLVRSSGPGPRYHFSMAVYPAGQAASRAPLATDTASSPWDKEPTHVFLVGGRLANRTDARDVWLLDLRHRVWREVIVTPSPPQLAPAVSCGTRRPADGVQLLHSLRRPGTSPAEDHVDDVFGAHALNTLWPLLRVGAGSSKRSRAEAEGLPPVPYVPAFQMRLLDPTAVDEAVPQVAASCQMLLEVPRLPPLPTLVSWVVDLPGNPSTHWLVRLSSSGECSCALVCQRSVP